MRTRRCSAVVASLVLALAAWLIATPAPSEASGDARRADAATAAGYDYHTLLSADVVAGSTANLVIRYTAGRAFANGVLRIVVPRAWSTGLRPVDALYESTPPGAFSVRPGIATPEGSLPEPTRTSGQVCAPVGPDNWDVANVPGGQLITVRGVICAAGRELAIRLEGVRAPSRPGVFAIPLLMTPLGAGPRLSVASVRVVAPPTTRLVVSGPSSVAAGAPFVIQVSAVRPDGRPDLAYRGAVAVVSEDQVDCTLVPRDGSVAYRFTAADRGTAFIQVQLDQLGARRLRVYDVGRKAVDGLSPHFEVAGPPPEAIICPVSYH
jgi:hypothetical protein